LGILTPDLEQPELERIEALVDCEARQPDLRRALDGLSPIVRSAVELRVMQGLPYAEVAERLSCTEVNARVRVARGIERMGLVLEGNR
jgi:RNA polymerase sigma-70 factor (ECF subfamily)